MAINVSSTAQKLIEEEKRRNAEARMKVKLATLKRMGSVDLYDGEPVEKVLKELFAKQDYAKAKEIMELMHRTVPLPPVRPAPPPVEPKPDVWAKLCMRMDWKLHGICHRVPLAIIEQAGKVFVFGAVDGNPFTIEDTAEMFPSDRVVTQLRMLNVREG